MISRLMIFFVSFLLGSLIAAGEGTDTVKAVDGPMLRFVTEELDLGIIDPDGSGEGEMEFTNAGTVPLLLKDVFVQCGCTAVSFPRESVAPGDTAKIKVLFKAYGRSAGRFKKVVRVRSNAMNPREFFYVTGSIKRRSMI